MKHWIMILCALALSGCVKDPYMDVSVTQGPRFLNSDWGDTDPLADTGIRIYLREKDRPIGIELGFSGANNSELLRPGATFMGYTAAGGEKGKAFINSGVVGVRRDWIKRNTSVYASAGGTLMGARMEIQNTPTGNLSFEDRSYGAYASAGVAYSILEHLKLGAYAAWTGGTDLDLNFMHTDADSLGFGISLSFAASFSDFTYKEKNNTTAWHPQRREPEKEPDYSAAFARLSNEFSNR